MLLLFWDLETTGRSCKSCRIVSIGWSGIYCNTIDESLQVYNCDIEGEFLVKPKLRISPQAYDVHGYDALKLQENGAISSKDALTKWMAIIEKENCDVVLVAHNGKSFDTHVLRHELVTGNIVLAKNIVGFIDSLHWLRWGCDIKKANIDNLLTIFFNEDSRDIHGALEDCRILKRIFSHALQKYGSKNLVKYFESTQDWLIRTNCYESETNVIKDMIDEILYKVEDMSCQHKNTHYNQTWVQCLDCDWWCTIKNKK